MQRLLQDGGKPALQASVDCWWPRVAASFGSASSAKAGSLKAMGLGKSTNAELKARWIGEAGLVSTKPGLIPGK